jgi:hypothetical protein
MVYVMNRLRKASNGMDMFQVVTNRMEQVLRSGLGDKVIDLMLDDQKLEAEIASNELDRNYGKWLTSHRKNRIDSIIAEAKTRAGVTGNCKSIWENLEWGWHKDPQEGYMVDLILTNKKGQDHWSFGINQAADRYAVTLSCLKRMGRIQ